MAAGSLNWIRPLGIKKRTGIFWHSNKRKVRIEIIRTNSKENDGQSENVAQAWREVGAQSAGWISMRCKRDHFSFAAWILGRCFPSIEYWLFLLSHDAVRETYIPLCYFWVFDTAGASSRNMGDFLGKKMGNSWTISSIPRRGKVPYKFWMWIFLQFCEKSPT